MLGVCQSVKERGRERVWLWVLLTCYKDGNLLTFTRILNFWGSQGPFSGFIYIQWENVMYVYVTYEWVVDIMNASYNVMHHFILRWYIHVWLGSGRFGKSTSDVASQKFVSVMLILWGTKGWENVIISGTDDMKGDLNMVWRKIFFSSSFERKAGKNINYPSDTFHGRLRERFCWAMIAVSFSDS